MTEDCKETGFSGEGRCIEPAVEDGRCVTHAARAKRPRCTRVTGKTFEPNYWSLPAERQGPRREQDDVRPLAGVYSHNAAHRPARYPEAVYDVLCGDLATHWVRSFTSMEVTQCCERCLSAIVDQMSGPEGSDGSRLPVTVGFVQNRSRVST